MDEPNPRRLETAVEPHERGSVLVAAVFDAFFRTYQRRIQDLLRIASGGTGRLPRGAIHPDLVHRLAEEAASVAQATLRMCIRAFNYLPPVDVTFGDYLRALVTADFELNPKDPTGLRLAMVEAFRERGIYPADVSSLSEDGLLWPRADPDAEEMGRGGKLTESDRRSRLGSHPEASNTSRNSALDQPAWGDERRAARGAFKANACGTGRTSNASLLHLAPDITIESIGFHPVFRVGRDGQLLVEVVVQFAQKGKTPDDDSAAFRCAAAPPWLSRPTASCAT